MNKYEVTQMRHDSKSITSMSPNQCAMLPQGTQQLLGTKKKRVAGVSVQPHRNLPNSD